jgi:hypothetical protein
VNPKFIAFVETNAATVILINDDGKIPAWRNNDRGKFRVNGIHVCESLSLKFPQWGYATESFRTVSVDDDSVSGTALCD